MKLGARNQLKGTVKQIKKGSLMCQITVDLDPKAACPRSAHLTH